MTKASVTLSQPIKRSDSEIKTISITDAVDQAGSLRGLKLVALANMEYDAVSVLLTRVTSPALKLTEISNLCMYDFMQFTEALIPFLNPAEPGEQSAAETAATS
ncbi:phage tail assembly protein [Pantoea agglomerans]|uniref:phage tail assembly protein n=1 Tax=Enterobacter agglomerans TaxID=549 RepID=UPI003BF59B20